MPSPSRSFLILFSFFALCARQSVHADAAFDNLFQAGKYQEAIQYADKQIPPASRTLDIWIALAAAYEKSGSAKDQILACYKEAQKVNPSEPRIHLALGDFYFNQKNWTEALRYFQSAFLLRRSGAAAEKMALCAANLNQWDKAKDAAESAVSLDSSLSECRPILVKLYIQEKNWTGAVEQLEFITKKGAPLDLWKQLSECYQKANLMERLPLADSMIVLLDKNNLPSRVRFAEHALISKDTTAAIRLYKEIAILSPGDSKSFKNLYVLSRARGNNDDATLYLKNYLVLDSSKADQYWQLGDLLYDKKDLNGALDSYHRAFKRAPQLGKGHFRQYADIVLQKKLDAESITVITAAIAAGEANVLMYASLGDIYRKQNNCPGAVKMYQEVLKTDPKNITVLEALADCQAKNGDTKNAILSFEQLVLMNPRPSQEYKRLGELQLKIGKRENAMTSYKKYLETVANDFAVAKTVGLYSFETKQYADAAKYLAAVQEPSLRDIGLLTAQGLSAFQLNDCGSVVNVLSKAWAAKPAPTVLAQILIPLADCFERTGAAAKAAEAYEAYASLPGVNNADVAYRGAFLKESSDRAGAIKAYTANELKYPRDYRNFLRLGLLYAADSAAAVKAVQNLTVASTLVDTVRTLWRTLAVLEGKQKNEPKELAAWQKLVSLDPQDPEGNRRVGTIQAGRKQYAQAIAPLEVVVTTGVQDYNLLRMLATCYLQTKRPKEALSLLRKAKTLQPDDPAVRVAIIAAAAAPDVNEPADKEKEELAEIDGKIIAKDKKNIESRVRLVEYYFDKKDFPSAYKLLKELAVLTPRDPVVYRKLYDISTRNGNNQEAAEYLRKYLALEPNNANAYRSLADLQYEQKDYDGALSSYRMAVKLSPQLKGFYKNYIDIVLQKKLDVEAISVIGAAIKNGEADMPAYLALGDIYRKKGQCADAIKMYQVVLKLDPRAVDAMASMGECQAATGDTKNAIICYEQVVLMKPKPSKEYKMLGDLQMRAGKTDAAIGAYRKYLDEVPADQTVAKTVGLYEYGRKQYPAAIKYFELVKDPSLQSVDYLVSLGESYYQTGDTKKTIELLAKAWAARPAPSKLASVLKILAECYRKTDQLPKAIEAYDAYVKIPGVRDQEASHLCGYLREKTDRPGSINAYASATALFPKDYRNFLRMGILLSSDSAAQSRASAALKQASVLVDTIPLLWETLARVDGRLKNDDGELQALQHLLVLQPQNLDANKRASALLLRKKQVAQAITNLEMVLTVAPNDVPTMLLLVEGYLETKRPAQALDLLTKAKGIDKNDIAIRSKLYDLCKETGQDQRAEAEIRDLIDITKDNKYRIKYANDLIAKQRYDEASKIIADIKASDPMNIEGLMLRGAIQKAQKSYSDAIETFKEISYINDNYVPALTARGDTYLLMGQPDRAEQYFMKAIKLDPKFALAELGMAQTAKAKKNMAAYQEHLAKAKLLNPKHPAILEEASKAGK